MASSRAYLLLLISTFALFTITASASPDLVIELFRHGARGPLNQTYDPIKDWGNDIGQLTPVGMRMHYLLGAALRQEYPHILSSYDPAKIYIRSTDVNRTIMSAYSQLYGVFNGTGPDLGSGINASEAVPAYQSPFIQDEIARLENSSALPEKFQVVPVHVVTTAEDLVLVGYSGCPMTKNLSKEYANDEEVKSVFANEMKDIVDYLKAQNLQIETFQDLYYAGDNAITNKFEEIPLPGHVDPVSQPQLYKDLKFAFEWFTVKVYENTAMQQALNSVNLLNAISGYINGTVNGTSSLEFLFLSAHDTTLMTLLSSFNITTKDCLLANYNSDKENGTTPFPNCIYPQYASNLIFEIYNTSEPYVIFYYNGLPVPFCGKEDNTCTITELQAYFGQVTDEYSVDDYKTMCGLTTTGDLNHNDNPNLSPSPNDNNNDDHHNLIYVLLGVSLVLLVSLIVTCIKLSKKGEDSRIPSKQSLMAEF